MNEENKNDIVQGLNVKIGDDITDLSNAEQLEKELTLKRNELQSSLNTAKNEVPLKLSETLQLAEEDTEELERIKKRNDAFYSKYREFFEPPANKSVFNTFMAVEKLQEVVEYLKTFEKIIHIGKLMKQCKDDEQVVQLYQELREQCLIHAYDNQTYFVRKISNSWHKILKDRLTESYEEVLKLLKWPCKTGKEYPPPAKEVMAKFTSLTKSLFMLKQPDDILTCDPDELVTKDCEPCLPVLLLLRPLRKRFAYHFLGSRPTARIDRPEWFLTQTLVWIRDHQNFLKMHVQPIADQLELKNINTVKEFIEGLIGLAAERLYEVLTSYENEEDIADADAAFAHAVDETLGFHKELTATFGTDCPGVISVLTKANIFVRWLAVEKKYSLYKLDAMLESDEWVSPVAGGAGGGAGGGGGVAGAGAAGWVPRGAHLFVTLLDTIQDRYRMLPQPGHRLQFLELQLDLVEEWRLRLTQILTASIESLTEASFLEGTTPHPLTATINAAHHTTTVLLFYSHSLQYLQLHYYRLQFEEFTQQQHRDETECAGAVGCMEVERRRRKGSKEPVLEETMSLNEIEIRTKELLLENPPLPKPPIADRLMYDKTKHSILDEAEDFTVFEDAPALMAHIRDKGLSALTRHILLEFKAALKDYRKLKWHSMPVIEESALCISPALCRPLSGLCARLNAATSRLAPPLTARLRADLAAAVDTYMFGEIFHSWFNSGGILQFTHDVKRNLVPAFAPPNKTASQLNQLPRLLEACKLLNMEFDEARRLRHTLQKHYDIGQDTLIAKGIRHILGHEAMQIFNQRTDLTQADKEIPTLMDLF